MHSRFYVPTLQSGDAAVRLPIDEARHLTRVLRLRVGDAVRVFNGAGLECAGQVDAVDRDEVTIAIAGQATPAPETATRITLAQAVLKGDGMDSVVRDAVMLGVSAVVPVLSTRVEGDRRSHAAGLRVGRWQRIAVASAKQCGRAVVPDITRPLPLPATLSSDAPGLRVVLVEPSCGLPTVALGELAAGGPPRRATLFVGPEGGWAEDELQLFAGREARAITLGRRTLRAESAAIVGLSVLEALWGEFE